MDEAVDLAERLVKQERLTGVRGLLRLTVVWLWILAVGLPLGGFALDYQLYSDGGTRSYWETVIGIFLGILAGASASKLGKRDVDGLKLAQGFNLLLFGFTFTGMKISPIISLLVWSSIISTIYFLVSRRVKYTYYPERFAPPPPYPSEDVHLEEQDRRT